MQTTPYPRYRPLSALRALRALAADPDDLPKVFTIIDSLPGRSPEEMLARMKSTDGGRRILREKPALAAIKQWKFEPGKRSGQPVRFRMRVPITFPEG